MTIHTDALGNVRKAVQQALESGILKVEILNAIRQLEVPALRPPER
jgi:hypothetical protein